MDHCGKFGHALWATVVKLVMCYGPLRRIFCLCFGPLQRLWLCAESRCIESNQTVKICDNFRDVGHSAGFGYSLWATAQNFFKR
jgi:hypothetical protein